MKKQIVNHTQVVNSLLELKQELWERLQSDEHNWAYREILLKINSCLFSTYERRQWKS